MTPGHLFCVGLGYTSQVLARRWLDRGWRVSGTCRSVEKRAALQASGIEAHVFDSEAPLQDAATALRGVTHLLDSSPPDEHGAPAVRQHTEDIATLGETLRWIGYLSTTGVYGDQQGRWIDETCAPAPLTASSRRRVTSEEQWAALGARMGVTTHSFRLPGIYGPAGRSAIDALQAGRARRIVKAGQVFNRMHVDDIASVLSASMQQPEGSSLYNLSDDEPAPADVVTLYAAELLGIEPPPEIAFEDAQLPPFAKHFYEECKRVRNDRIKQELGVKLAYPTYREGLRAIAAQLGA